MMSHTPSCVVIGLCSVLLQLLSWKPVSGIAATENIANLTIEADCRVAKVGTTVLLNCRLGTLWNQTGEYNATDLQWLHNDAQLSGGRVHTLDAATSQLILAGVEIEDGGAYSCCLTPACAEARSASTDILVGWPPEPPTDLHCSSYNFRNANCTWTRGGQQSNLPTKDVVLRRKNTLTSSGEWASCNADVAATCTATTCYISCTTDHMNFSYRVNSSNDLDYSLSAETSFNLDTETVPNPPTHVDVTNRSSSSLIVRWGLPRGLYVSAISSLIGYCIFYKWEGDKEFTKIKRDWENKYVLNNLSHPYGLYTVKVGSYPLYGRKRCKFSKTVSRRTSEIAPQNSPGNVTCRQEESVNLDYKGTRNIILNWELLPSEYKQNGEIRDYVITVHDQNRMEPVTKMTIGPNQTSCRIEGLANDMPYDISIEARNSMGPSDQALCSVKSNLPAVSFVLVYAVLIPFLCLLLLMLLVAWAWRRYKKTVRRWPDFELPEQLSNNNFAHTRHRTLVREREEFDELLPEGLPVDLLTEETHVDSSQVTAILNGGIANGFQTCTSDENLQLVAGVGLQDLKQPTTGCDMDLLCVLSPDARHVPGQRVRYPSSGASSVHSLISVGSGGSYLLLHDPNKPSSPYKRDCLSPIQMDGQKVRGAGSSCFSVIEGKEDFARWAPHFVWDEGSIQDKLFVEGVDSEASNHASESSHQGSCKSAKPPVSPLHSPYCRLGMQGKRDATDELRVENHFAEIGLAPGVGLVPLAEEQEESENETTEEQANSDDSLEGAQPYLPMFGSFHLLPGAAGGTKQNTEPEVFLFPGETSPIGYCKMGQVDWNKLTETAEGQNASSPLLPVSLKNNINLLPALNRTKELNCTGLVEGSEESAQSQCRRDVGNTEGFVSEREPFAGVTPPVHISTSFCNNENHISLDATEQNDIDDENSPSHHAADECQCSLNYIIVSKDSNEDEEEWDTRIDVTSSCTTQSVIESDTAAAKRVHSQNTNTGLEDSCLPEGYGCLNYVAVGPDEDEEAEEEQGRGNDVSLLKTSSYATQPLVESDTAASKRVPSQEPILV